MSFTVSFYTSTANPKKLDKSGDITIIGTAKTLHVKHKIDMLNPVFDVDYNSLFLPANYVYIAEFGRYYFCTIATDTAQKITVSCTVDPLFSFATAIKNCPCTVVRSEKAGITYVPDNKLPIDPNKYRVGAIPSPSALENALNDKPYILILNAGVNSQ